MARHELAELSQKITNHFNMAELKGVLMDLGIDTEEFSGPLSMYSIEVVKWCNRRDRIVELAKALSERKSMIDFSAWGAPLPSESLQGVLRQLLEVGFSNSELSQMCFDLFYELHGDVNASMSKSRTIEMIIDHAIKTDEVIAMMNWVNDKNPYQYGNFFVRVDRALSEHQNKETIYAPAPSPINEPTQKVQPIPQSANDAVILALEMYGNGLNDGGELARKALAMIGK